MNYYDRLKELFFTERDRGIRYPDDYNREAAIHSDIIQRGARSQVLMSNAVFQEAVTQIYLTLEAQLDSIEDTDHNAAEQIRWIRTQRRALRQVCALLDNQIAAQEQLETSLKENVDEKI